jgi:hypothetical protein
MRMTIIKLFIASLLSIPFFVNGSYNEDFSVFDGPAYSEDLKVVQLTLLLNHKTKGIVRKVSYCIPFVNDQGVECGFYLDSRQYVKSVDCYKESTNPKIVVCEVVLNKLNLAIRDRVLIIRGIYQAILNHAKSIIHPSFEPAHLRVIMKVEEVIKIKMDAWKEIEQICVNSLLADPEETILVIWENGIPFYQDAFFEQPYNEPEFDIDLTRRD